MAIHYCPPLVNHPQHQVIQYSPCYMHTLFLFQKILYKSCRYLLSLLKLLFLRRFFNDKLNHLYLSPTNLTPRPKYHFHLFLLILSTDLSIFAFPH